MFQASGVSGELKWGYRTVARLGTWSLDGTQVTAKAEDVNSYLADQDGPFTLRLAAGRRFWVWKTAEIIGREPFVVRVNGSPDNQK